MGLKIRGNMRAKLKNIAEVSHFSVSILPRPLSTLSALLLCSITHYYVIGKKIVSDKIADDEH